jgi:hypothetical protein
MLTIDLELNIAGQYAAVLEYGRIWRATAEEALSVAEFVLGRPVKVGKMTLVE